MRMRRVPFFLSRLLFANKINEEEKGKKCEMDKWERCQNWCKKYSTQPKAEKEKKEKKDPSRRHIDVTSVAIV